jgi:hypothetical protein
VSGYSAEVSPKKSRELLNIFLVQVIDWLHHARRMEVTTREKRLINLRQGCLRPVRILARAFIGHYWVHPTSVVTDLGIGQANHHTLAVLRMASSSMDDHLEIIQSYFGLSD